MLDIYYSKTDDGKKVQNIVFEYCSENLEDVIQKAKEKQISIPIKDVKDYMKQILTGMAYVHKQ
jgi:serine/threonine protein kinase